ncbi:MAG TPA: hypothetical protein VFB82_08435 [Blastocatellia bacterium]|nr:hypothetical protein [Blastocatellia bacterium]
MAITNHDRVGKALDLLNSGLMPFFERELTPVLGHSSYGACGYRRSDAASGS